MESIIIREGDITKFAVDAIVNAANNALSGGGGVDGAIHRAAGPELKTYCRKQNGCKTGDVVVTPGFNLPAKYVFHTAGPVWYGGHKNERLLLQSCYFKSLELATEYNLASISFPSISTGAYRFPLQEACTIAVQTIATFLQDSHSNLEVYLIAFDTKTKVAYEKALSKWEQKES